MISQQRGFTLIEVLAAFMVFSLVFAVVMQLTTSSIKNVALSKDYTEVALWAESKFAEVRSRKEITEGTEYGDFSERFRWELQIDSYDNQSTWPLTEEEENLSSGTTSKPPIELMRVQLKISWNNDTHQTQFITLVSRKPKY